MSIKEFLVYIIDVGLMDLSVLCILSFVVNQAPVALSIEYSRPNRSSHVISSHYLYFSHNYFMVCLC